MSLKLSPGLPATLLATAMLAQAPTPVEAQMFCSEPVAPYCLDDSRLGRDSLNITRCKQDVEDFAAKVSEYLACLDENAADLEARVTEMRQQIEELETQAEEEADMPSED